MLKIDIEIVKQNNMYIKSFLLCIFFIIETNAFSQHKTSQNFEKFADQQDSLFKLAYEQKDTKTFDKLLKEFLSKYNKLPDTIKQTFKADLMNAYYNLSCTYSLLGDKVMALNYLKKSIETGYFDYGHVQQDKDLDNIRNEKEFNILVEPTRKIGDYIYILRKAKKYNIDDKRELPEFTYQSSDNPSLVALRKTFNLDSIAGTGNEVSKILNLLHWIHYLIPHDGTHGNPVVQNAMSMISECKKNQRGLNCRGLAMVLNECYLSIGIKSRFITCLPKDSLGIDQDCHVINMVYSENLKKWLWIDPTFDAYVMNDKGELLSIEEVRERIINNKPLILNPDANWNRKSSQTKEDYLFHYMAKNLYRLECPVNSEYDTETQYSGKVVSYIELLPIDYFNQLPDKTEKINAKVNVTIVIYKTNNSNYFWKTP